MRVDFRVRDGPTAAAVGVGGGAQDYARMLLPYKGERGCRVDVPADAPAVWIYVFEHVCGHWVLRGGAAVQPCALRADWTGLEVLPLTNGTRGVAGVPRIDARSRGKTGRLPWRQMPERAALLATYCKVATGELMEAMRLRVAPPLLADTLHGRLPFGATFATPLRVPAATVRALLQLACNLDAAECAVETLAGAHPDVAARVLARIALVANTVRYVADDARAIDGGTVPTNTFTDASMTWTDDCEGATAITAGLWRALGQVPEVRGLVAAYRFVVVATTIVTAAPGAYHVCAALLPRAVHAARPAALVESVVRTAALPVRGDAYARPADRTRERPLVAVDGTLNRWYGDVAFALDAERPLELLLPHVDGRPGGSLADLLAGVAALEPMTTTLITALNEEILAEVAWTPATDFGAARLEVVPGDARLGNAAMAEGGGRAHIRVRHPEPGVAERTFAFE